MLGQRRELRGEVGDAFRGRMHVGRGGRVEHVPIQIPGRDDVRLGPVAALIGVGPRGEQPEPRLVRPVARLVIAAHENPRRGYEQRRRGGEEIGTGRGPGIARGAAGATRVARGTWVVPVEVVADVNDQIRPPRRGTVGNLRKRPRRGIVAGLHEAGLDAAAGVAHDDDLLRL